MFLQILSRAQGQLNTLAGQVANSIKAMDLPAVAALRQQQQQQQATTSQLVNCLDSVAAQSIPGIVQGNEVPVTVNVEQALTVPRVAAGQTVSLENATAGAVTMAAGDMAPCNGSAGILVFQQKPVPAPAPTNVSSVPVLVRIF